MSKISPTLKALIESPHARPNTTPPPPYIRDVYTRILRQGKEKQYGLRPSIALAAAATFTLNSPQSLVHLHSVSSSLSPFLTPLSTAELIREIGLKCISFNGIPRTINCLGEFRSSLAVNPWSSQLSTAPSRTVTSRNVEATLRRGKSLWDSIYTPFEDKLVAKLAESHPDLPVHILSSHYGPLLANPASEGGDEEARQLGTIGRCLTSVVAIACLRAQTGVGPQVLSHVYGLRKGVEQGWAEREYAAGGVEPGEKEGLRNVASNEGLEWILNSVDNIAKAIGGKKGNFAGGWEVKPDEEVRDGEVVKRQPREEGEEEETVEKEADEVEKELGGDGNQPVNKRASKL